MNNGKKDQSNYDIEAQKIEKYDKMSNEDQLFLRKLSNNKVKSEEKYQNSS